MREPGACATYCTQESPSLQALHKLIALDDLRRAALRATAYQGDTSAVTPLRAVDGEPT
jgi:hypothetical protein